MLKRDLMKLVGKMLLGGVVLLGVLPACVGSTPTQSVPMATATAAQPTPSAAPARTPTTILALTPTAGASAPASPVPIDDRLAKGKLIFEKTAGGVGCAYCHGLDGKGNGPAKVNAPNIRGKNEGDVRAAISGGVPMMSIVKLNDEEITAVVAYLQYLNQ